MTECNQLDFELPGLSGRKIEGNFRGGDVSSDGGLVVLRQVDRWLGLSKGLAQRLPDRRDPDKIEHSLESMLRQRIYGLALGYEDLNDHDSLRKDLLWQTATERDQELASCSTLCRLENRAGRQEAWLMHQVLFEQFLNSFQSAPRELVLDFDCTDDRVHGLQEGRHFHGYYDDFCFLPLYVFCGERLLVSYLRESNIDSARHAWAILALLVKALRKRWPQVKITLRADSGFCRWKMLRWCERMGVGYIVGLAKNERLQALSAKLQKRAERKYRRSGSKVRLFSAFQYKAKTWDKKRRVIVKAEHNERGANPRYVVTNLEGRSQALYDELYCARGEMENRIKEQQLGLFSDRTSCHAWWPNQFRLLLSSAAYVLLEALRRIGLSGTDLARAQVTTIRLRLLKIGAVITRNTRRIRLWFSSSFPLQELFCSCLARFYG
jgi:Transposase DDE domain group 1